MKSSGLTHGPFYYHFSSKEALMAESVEHAMQQGAFDVLAPIGTTPESKAKFIQSYLSAAHRDSLGKGCVIAALASEIRREPAVRGPFTTQVKAFVEKLALRFPWSSKRAARGDSIRMLSSIVGALILARAVDDDAFSEEILREVRHGLL
jgi:TetR/AcrR family transcriptional repressor of nem operon